MTKIYVATTLGLAAALPASAAVDAALTAAAATFSEDFLASSAAIGAVMIGAAFGAIIWQWLKAAIFS
jgi:hypothetical protein